MLCPSENVGIRHQFKRNALASVFLDFLGGPLARTEVANGRGHDGDVGIRNRILHGCMGEMNPDYREVLYLTYFEGMSYEQAAEVMGKTVKQITNLVYRGKESLRKLLEREGITNAEP